ncbi:hypothetical protein Bbelb_288270 [Branchiostoma belcheri]|nr:hypothetical protein Bbelb_288270 [Branchiostoma belcheri]
MIDMSGHHVIGGSEAALFTVAAVPDVDRQYIIQLRTQWWEDEAPRRSHPAKTTASHLFARFTDDNVIPGSTHEVQYGRETQYYWLYDELWHFGCMIGHRAGQNSMSKQGGLLRPAEMKKPTCDTSTPLSPASAYGGECLQHENLCSANGEGRGQDLGPLDLQIKCE